MEIILILLIERNEGMNMQNKKGSVTSILCVLAAGMLWGCMGILVRSMKASGFNSMEVTAFRSFVTAIIMLIGMLVFNRRALIIKIRDVWCFIGTGVLSVIFFNVCYFTCMSLTTLSTAAILLYTAPSFVMILSFFLFKEKLTRTKVIALIIAFIGCVLVSGGFQTQGIGVMGLLTGIGAGFGYGLYSIFSRFALQRGYSSYTITIYTFLFAAVGSIPFLDFHHVTSCLKASTKQIPFAILMAILTTVVAYLLYTKGLSGMENTRASIIASIEPVVATLVGWVLYHETLKLTNIAGMILVLFSCVYVVKKTEKNQGKYLEKNLEKK